MQDVPSASEITPAAQHLAANLSAALNVAGRVGDDDRARPLFATEIQRRKKIARSTLRSLTTNVAKKGPNPDLATLGKLAQVIGIPPSFLLMGATDWSSLINAMVGLNLAIEAAQRLVVTGKFTTAKLVIQIITDLKVHPERSHYQEREDKFEKAKLDARNRWRERSCRVFSALIDRNVGDLDQRVLLAAFAASYVIHSTPHNPDDAKKAESANKAEGN